MNLASINANRRKPEWEKGVGVGEWDPHKQCKAENAQLKAELELLKQDDVERCALIRDMEDDERRMEDELAHATQREARLREALTELYALVRGECQRLLNEDSGGDAELAYKIEAALEETGI